MSMVIPETIRGDKGYIYFKYHTYKFRNDMSRDAERLQHMGYKTIARTAFNTNTLYSNPKAYYSR